MPPFDLLQTLVAGSHGVGPTLARQVQASWRMWGFGPTASSVTLFAPSQCKSRQHVQLKPMRTPPQLLNDEPTLNLLVPVPVIRPGPCVFGSRLSLAVVEFLMLASTMASNSVLSRDDYRRISRTW